jgi:murein DD-endopeptidase MepM/ murein hydrolase activator NlpD
MENRHPELNVAREAAALFATLAIVVGSIAFYSLANASPAEQPVTLRQPAAAVRPVVASGGHVAHRRIKATRTRRVRFTRLPDFRRVSNPKTLGFQWPTVGSHEITSAFGPRDGGFHHGTDVACGIGQRLYASRAGRVIGVGDAGPGYGLTVWIDHGSGYQTLYGHMSKLEVQLGQAVRTRQEIGRCGESGNASGPHVLFEMRYGGYVWDPVRFLP